MVVQLLTGSLGISYLKSVNKPSIQSYLSSPSFILLVFRKDLRGRTIIYVFTNRAGSHRFSFHMSSHQEGDLLHTGQVGSTLGVEDAVKAAKLCGLNLVAQMREACDGNLDRVKKVSLGFFWDWQYCVVFIWVFPETVVPPHHPFL